MDVIYGLVDLATGHAVPIKVGADGVLLVRSESNSNSNSNSDSNSTYASIVDTASSAQYIYMCEALPGADVNAAVWRISRMENSTGITKWADGNANFDNVAANRAALAYS